MEETKTTRPSSIKEEQREGSPGCMLWIFGDENSADNDLRQKFEIVDEENQDNA